MRYPLDSRLNNFVMFAIGKLINSKLSDAILIGFSRGIYIGEEVTCSGTVTTVMGIGFQGFPTYCYDLEVVPDHLATWPTAEYFVQGINRNLTISMLHTLKRILL